MVRAYISDQFHNPVLLPDPPALSAHVATPDGAEHALTVTLQTKAGRVGSYDIRCETSKRALGVPMGHRHGPSIDAFRGTLE